MPGSAGVETKQIEARVTMKFNVGLKLALRLRSRQEVSQSCAQDESIIAAAR
jgi:hypothetical protein